MRMAIRTASGAERASELLEDGGEKVDRSPHPRDGADVAVDAQPELSPRPWSRRLDELQAFRVPDVPRQAADGDARADELCQRHPPVHARDDAPIAGDGREPVGFRRAP